MKSLSKEDQAQLDALLAKKEAAEKMDDQVRKAVDHIEYQTKALATSIKVAESEAQSVIAVFNTLKAVDKDLFRLTVKEAKFENEFNPAGYSKERDYTAEEMAAAWKHLDQTPMETVLATSQKYSIEIIGLTGYANKPAKVDTQAQTRSSGGWSYKSTGKTELKMSCADYNERWVTKPETLVRKINEEISRREHQKEAAKKANSLKDDALCAVADLHPEAHSTFEKEWKHQPSYNRRRSEGYEVEYIKATFENGMELNYSFRRVEDEGLAYDVKVELSKTNFGILAALKVANTPEELATKLSGLYNVLKDK